MKIFATLSTMLLLLTAPLVSGATTVMYEYDNEQGDPVFSYTLPSDQAEKGYRVIDPATGNVLKEVAPQLPPDELAAKLRREQALRECREELDRIYQLYGSEKDIDYALQETVASLETRIGQLQANLRQARREQDRLRAQAADAERAGREVARSLVSKMQRSQSQIANLEGEIATREREQSEARQRYAYERDRFRDGSCPNPETIADAGRR